MNDSQSFYNANPDKARELIAKQIADGWEYEDIVKYFESLGYDAIFIGTIVNPFFINKI